MAHHKLTKHEIKEDSFVTFVLKSWEYIRAHQNIFFFGLLTLIVVIVGSVWATSSRMRTRTTAESQFSEAIAAFRMGEFKTAEEMFKIVTERFPGLKEGAYASYFTGKCALIDGRNSHAVESFEKYLKESAKYPFFRDAAMDGIGTVYENERNYGKAAEIYVNLVNGLKTNTFLESEYLEKAAKTLKMSNQTDKAIEMYERLLDKSTGLDRRNVEIELEILRG